MAQAQPTQGAMPGQLAQPAQTDPLANLRDIHIPSALDTWPPAIGWWLLAASAILATGYAVYWILKWWKSNQYRREGVRELNLLLENHASEPQYLEQYSSLLKRVALSKYARESVANLTGEAWVSFLDSTTGTQEFSMGEGQVLIQGNYELNPKVDVAKLHSLGLYWIKKHRKIATTSDQTKTATGASTDYLTARAAATLTKETQVT